MKKLLEIENVEKYYGNHNSVTKALNDISLSVDKGEFLAIMGASGSGKTTLLNCISTIDNVTSGKIYIDNNDITSLSKKNLDKFRRDNLGFIFQDFNLLNTLNAYDNIALALTLKNEKYEMIDSKINEISELLNIKDVLNKYPYQMSGGQQQRVSCARAIISKPKLVLADEPTGSLDSKSSGVLLEYLNKLNKTIDTTILMVTHDAFSASYASKVIFIKDGKLFNEIYRGEKNRKEFFNEIMDIISLLGGELNDAL